jgi:CHAD domain-containing protein
MAATAPDRDALQRELEQSIGQVLALSRSHKQLSGKTVHEMRKVLKRVRAALRLVRDAVGKDEYARENALLRDAGRALRAARDAEVMLGVVTDLSHRKAAKRVAAPLDRARRRYASART